MPFNKGEIVAEVYTIDAQVGMGPCGPVYRALDDDSGRWVALKELDLVSGGLNPVSFADHLRILRHELELQADFHHPNILNAHRLVELGRDHVLLAVEYMESGSLRALLDSRRRLPVTEAVGLIRQVLSALDAVHKDPREIVHRNIHPGNILLGRRGQVKLGDFGLAQVGAESLRSRTQQPHPGKPDYMSPEQAATQDYLTPASDLFSLGCILFEMTTGTSYRQAVSAGDTLRSLLPGAPLWLEESLASALETEPARRCQRARDLDAILAAGFGRENQHDTQDETRLREAEEKALRKELLKAEEAVEDKARRPGKPSRFWEALINLTR